jgi:hypothetical protein
MKIFLIGRSRSPKPIFKNTQIALGEDEGESVS